MSIYWQYVVTVLLLLILPACKTVDVFIPAAYPLAKEQAVVVHTLAGSNGAGLSQQVLAILQQKMPQMVFYFDDAPATVKAVHLAGSVDSLTISKPQLNWGSYNKKSSVQYGHVLRTGSIRVSLRLLGDDHRVLWSNVFTKEVRKNKSFSMVMHEPYESLDGISDVVSGDVKSGIHDILTVNKAKEKAYSYTPKASQIRNKLLANISKQMANVFYDRSEQRLEFR